MSRSVDTGGGPVDTTYTYDKLNQLKDTTTSGVTTTYTYDKNGNRTDRAVGGGGTNTAYVYDTSDRLVQVDNDGNTVFEASYDARTRRLTVEETVGSTTTTTYYRYDNGLCCQELVSNNLQVEYLRGPGMGGGIGGILYADRSAVSGPINHFTYNAVGNTIALTDASGAISQINLYEAFGSITQTTGSSDNNRLANTKEKDQTTGLYNHGMRYYDEETGEYITCDPIGYADGMNVFPYVGGNPVNRIDPTGLAVITLGNEGTVGQNSAGPSFGQLNLPNRSLTPSPGIPKTPQLNVEGAIHKSLTPKSQLSDINRVVELADQATFEKIYKQGAPKSPSPPKQDTTNWGEVATDVATDFTPGVSNVKDFKTAVSGVNPVTGEKVGFWGRGLALATSIPVAGNFLKVGTGSAKAARKIDKAIDTANSASTAGRAAKGLIKRADELRVAREGVKSGNVTVYRSIDPVTGNVNYIGITKDVKRRRAEQLRTKGIHIKPIEGLENLSRADAKAVEQVLIEQHGLDTLINKINSISPRNPIYKDSIDRGRDIINQTPGLDP